MLLSSKSSEYEVTQRGYKHFDIDSSLQIETSSHQRYKTLLQSCLAIEQCIKTTARSASGTTSSTNLSPSNPRISAVYSKGDSEISLTDLAASSATSTAAPVVFLWWRRLLRIIHPSLWRSIVTLSQRDFVSFAFDVCEGEGASLLEAVVPSLAGRSSLLRRLEGELEDLSIRERGGSVLSRFQCLCEKVARNKLATSSVSSSTHFDLNQNPSTSHLIDSFTSLPSSSLLIPNLRREGNDETYKTFHERAEVSR